MPSNLNLKFYHQFQFPVWEIKANAEKLMVNIRDSECFESQFSLVDLKKKELEWQGLEFEDPWWVSVYHFYNEIVVFQKFEDSQDIDSRSVFGFDIRKQETLWAFEDVQLLTAKGNSLILKDQQEESFQVNVRNGEQIEVIEDLEFTETIQYPLHYEEDSEYFETLARFLKLKANVELIGSCDYLEQAGLIFIGANHVINGQKSLTMYVFDETGTLLFNESLETGVKGLVSGAFFIADEALIFVTGKNELKIYSIDEKN